MLILEGQYVKIVGGHENGDDDHTLSSLRSPPQIHKLTSNYYHHPKNSRHNRISFQVLSQITEKQTALSEDLGRDANSVKGLQRKHHNFERDLLTLAKQVQTVQEEAAKLQAAYAGDKVS